MSTQVTETGDTMVFQVASERFPDKAYRVDLLYGNGAGYCACRDHQVRRQPFIDQGGDPFSRQGCCKHTAKAREFFLQKLLKRMAKMEQAEASA